MGKYFQRQWVSFLYWLWLLFHGYILISKHIKLYIFNIYNFLYVNHISNKAGGKKQTNKNTTNRKQKYKIRRFKSFEGVAVILRTRVKLRLGESNILMLELKYWLKHSDFYSKRNMKSLESLIHLIKNIKWRDGLEKVKMVECDNHS